MLSINRILVPIDFSEYCTEALSYAREMAAVHGAKVDLLHVVEEMAFPAFYQMGEAAMYGEVSSLRERAIEALADCAGSDGADLGGDVEFYVEEGRPAEKIIEIASAQGSDLIVISTHGLSGIERVLTGSVAQQVFQEAPCPVFVISAKGKSLLKG